MSRPKTVLVRNVGTGTARFSLNTNSAFAVEPNHGELAVGEAMQVTVEFRPNVLGDINGEMCVSYDTGEDVFIDLHGVGVNLDVRLNQSELNIAPTYIGKFFFLVSYFCTLYFENSALK